jgi:hypothetical protein
MSSGRDIELVAQAPVSNRLATLSNSAGNLTLRRPRPVRPMRRDATQRECQVLVLVGIAMSNVVGGLIVLPPSDV